MEKSPFFNRWQWCDEAAPSIRHKGWFTDPDGVTFKDGTGLVRGIVAQLPHGRILAGYCLDGHNYVWYHQIYTDLDDAAHEADSLAENLAEDEREYQTKYREADSLRESIEDDKIEAGKNFALRHHKVYGFGCKVEVQALVSKIREAQHKLETEYKEFE